jgi:single-strand DNA-binding protein
MSLSNYSFTGNIGNDVKVRQAGSRTVADFSVAVNTGYADTKNIHWVQCTMWGRKAEGGLIKFLKKGQLVGVSGIMSESVYVNDQGVTCKNIEVNVSHVDLMGNKQDSIVVNEVTNETKDTEDSDVPF